MNPSEGAAFRLLANFYQHASIFTSLHAHMISRVRCLDVDLSGQMFVETSRDLGEVVATAHDIAAQSSSIDGGIFGRQICDRPIDRLVGDARPDVGNDRLPVLPGQPRQQPAILLPTVQGQPLDERILRRIALKDRNVDFCEPRAHTVVAHEGHVPIFRDRLPARVSGKFCPAPLLAMSIEVSEKNVQQSCPQERLYVHFVFVVPRKSGVEFVVIDDLGGAVETLAASGSGHGILEERPHHARKLFAKLSEPRIVGHHHHALANGENAGRFRQHTGHRRARRMLRCHLVLHDGLDDSVVEQ